MKYRIYFDKISYIYIYFFMEEKKTLLKVVVKIMLKIVSNAKPKNYAKNCVKYKTKNCVKINNNVWHSSEKPCQKL